MNSVSKQLFEGCVAADVGELLCQVGGLSRLLAHSSGSLVGKWRRACLQAW